MNEQDIDMIFFSYFYSFFQALFFQFLIKSIEMNISPLFTSYSLYSFQFLFFHSIPPKDGNE